MKTNSNTIVIYKVEGTHGNAGSYLLLDGNFEQRAKVTGDEAVIKYASDNETRRTVTPKKTYNNVIEKAFGVKVEDYTIEDIDVHKELDCEDPRVNAIRFGTLEGFRLVEKSVAQNS